MPNPEEMMPVQPDPAPQQVPAAQGPNDDFDYVNRGMELDDLGGAKAKPDDPLGMDAATDKSHNAKRAAQQLLGDSYDLVGDDEKKMVFDLMYGMSEDEVMSLVEDEERARQVTNAVSFGGAKEIQEVAKEFLNKKRLEDFMTVHLPDYQDLEKPSDTIEMVKQEEALRLKPYKDIAGHWTVGWGHKLSAEELKRFKNGIDKSQAEYLFEQDWNMARAQAQDVFRNAGHDWDSLDQNRRDMLTEMTFNVGSGGLSRYKTLLTAIQNDDYKEMAKYHRRFAKDEKTGEWTDLHRNQRVFDMFIKPNLDPEAMPEIEAHWQRKNSKLGIQGSRPVRKIREGQRTHTLGRGQTLSAVGRQYGMPVRSIMEANPDIKNRHKIKSGDTLIIPRKEK